MNLTRFNQAPAYHPPHHEGMTCLRLPGHEAGTVQAQPALWLGLSILAPGGHTALDASALEKHYVVLQGSLTLITEAQGQRQETQLHPFDSVAIAPHESRQLYNHSPHEARVLLAMPMPPLTHPG
jgi:quercetin dioxygenase-like cupin family protein